MMLNKKNVLPWERQQSETFSDLYAWKIYEVQSVGLMMAIRALEREFMFWGDFSSFTSANLLT